MLKNLFKDTYQRLRLGGINKKKNALVEEINVALKLRQPQLAITLLRDLLKIEPNNVGALMELGVRLGDVGNVDEAYRVFELAYRLDDSNMHVAVNYASYLNENLKKSEQAIALLVRAQLLIPNYPAINSVYASVQLALGRAEEAKEYRLRGWLADFDNVRMADGYLWFAAYADISASALAAEHHFWAQTCVPLPYESATVKNPQQPNAERKSLRIGYWSPDFRNHSVRYFFRPMLEGHDRSKVELFLYHDSAAEDEQTIEIKSHCDHFHSVHGITDEILAKLIASHDLDVLVELAGHTSHNRLWMLQARLARVQITALGYPATTGLESVDAKLVDAHIFHPGDEKYYSERPLVMPQSFWCFDPREDIRLPKNAPVKINGHITFGCIGNVGKINPRMLALWAEILRRVPRSRLVLRSVNFIDPLSIEFTKNSVALAGIDERRVDFLGPANGKDFFRSYDKIDIVLDTYPFNGGTTSCFAAYMGVPIVTMAGESVLSRMGASVMANAGGAKWIAVNEHEYVSKAIKLSQDIEELQDFRSNARARMLNTSLGNGKKFASEFEDACLNLIYGLSAGHLARNTPMPKLKAEEIIRRAATVLGSGQQAAAKRIINYCLDYYPNFAGAHILATDAYTEMGDFTKAAEYLLEHFEIFDEEGKTAALINIVRFMIFADDNSGIAENIRRLQDSTLKDALETAQTDLYVAFLDWNSGKVLQVTAGQKWKKIHCVVACDDVSLYESIILPLQRFAMSDDAGDVIFERCAEALRTDAYERALQAPDADIVIFLQKNVFILNGRFFHEVAEALLHSDVLGYSGVRKWSRLDWRLESVEKRYSSFISESSEKPGCYQVLIAGLGRQKIADGMDVLEGGLIAVKANKVAKIPFDVDLLDADSLMEECWTHAAARSNLKLVVHRALGVQIRSDIKLSRAYLAASRMLLVERMKFEVFSTSRNDGSFLVCPCTRPEDGCEITNYYFLE